MLRSLLGLLGDVRELSTGVQALPLYEVLVLSGHGIGMLTVKFLREGAVFPLKGAPDLPFLVFTR